MKSIKILTLACFVLFSFGCSKDTSRALSSREGGDDELGITYDDSDELGLTYTKKPRIKARLRPRKLKKINSTLAEKYPPRTAAFTDNRTTSRKYMNATWEKMSLVNRAKHVHNVAENLLKAHGLTKIYTPRIITCKNYRESTFNPQIGAPNSSANGMSQILKGTLTYLMKGKRKFMFKTPGFTDVTTAATLIQRLPRSMNAQIESGIGVLEMKSRRKSVNRNNVKSILGAYFGSPQRKKDPPGKAARCNADYANRIFNCALCMKKSGINMKCLQKAKGGRRGC